MVRLTVDVILSSPALVDAIYQVARTVTLDIKRELSTMSGTLSQRIDAATAAIGADLEAVKSGVANVSADVDSLQKQIADLQAAMPPGSTVTEAQAASLEALASGLADARNSLDAVAARTPDMPPPPVEEPPPVPTP